MRVTEALRKQGMENCGVLWILGQDGEEEHKINKPLDIATNSSRQYFVADKDLTIKVLDNSGKFVERFRFPPLIDDSGNKILVNDRQVRLVRDINDNIYALVKEGDREKSCWIFKLNKTAYQHHTFPLRKMDSEYTLGKLSVGDIEMFPYIRVKRKFLHNIFYSLKYLSCIVWFTIKCSVCHS